MTEPKVIQTIRNKDIPADVKERAIREARDMATWENSDLKFDKNEPRINTFVVWSRTQSGYDFWRHISNAPDLPPKIDWLTTAYIASEAAKGLIPAIEVSIESWQQRRNAGEEELRRALKEGLVAFCEEHCGLCCHYGKTPLRGSCDGCCLNSTRQCCEEYRAVWGAKQEWQGNGPYSDLKDAMDVMIARLEQEKDKAVGEMQARTYQQGKECCKKKKPELRHGNYGHYKSSGGRWWVWKRNGILEVFGEKSGCGSPAPSLSSTIKDGNHIDDLEALQEDVSEFNMDVHQYKLDLSPKMAHAPIYIAGNWHPITEAKWFILKLRQLVATAERKEESK